MGIIYAAGNLNDVNTVLSVTSEDTVYIKEWMYNRRQSKPFRFTAKSGNQILIDGGAGGISPTIAALMNHNLAGTSGGGAFLCKIKGDDNNPPGGGWDAPTYSRDIAWHTLNMYKLLDGAPTYRYWLLDIDDFDNALTGCNIGEFVLTEWGTFSRGVEPGSRRSHEHLIFDNETPYGQRWKAFKATRDAFSVSFPAFTDTKYRSEVQAFFDALQGVYPFVFIPDEDEDDCWYMEVPNILEAERQFKDCNSFTLDLIEQTRGITIL